MADEVTVQYLRCPDCGTTYPPGQYRQDEDGQWETLGRGRIFGVGCAWCGSAGPLELDEVDEVWNAH